MSTSRFKSVSLDSPVPVTDELVAGMGTLLVQQVKERFKTQGKSANIGWPSKRISDGRSILTGRSAGLLNSFTWIQEGAKRVSVLSTAPYAFVHQLGTIGKGGTLPTVRPVRAKALFIPLNDRAASSTLVRTAVVIDNQARGFRKLRVATRGGPAPLKYGRDFVLAKKVDIPPRPMLPDSDHERRDQMAFLAEQVVPGD